MILNIANLKSRDAIKNKSIGNEGNMNGQTHYRGTLIFPTQVIIKARDATTRRATERGTLSNYAQS